MKVGERVKAVRMACGKMTQEDFAKPLGVKKAAISRIESGDRPLTEQMLLSICRVYGVSEEWLRSGDGEMLAQRSGAERLKKLVDDMLASRDDLDKSFRARLVAAIFELTPEQIGEVERFAQKLFDEEQRGREPDLDIDAELAEYRRQLEAEKSQEAESCQSHASGE